MEFDVIIVGGGLAGASLAVSLRTTQRRIALIESTPPRLPQGWDQRVYAVSAASRNFLSKLGVWERLDSDRVQSVREMHVYGDDGGKLHFSAYEAGLGSLAWIVESARLQHELWETLKRQHNVELFSPANAENIVIDEDAVAVQLAGGRSLRARLLVGADGGRSRVREAAGIGANVRPYGELGVVANFLCEKPHHGVARQWFRDDAVLAWLPLPGKRISIVWSAPEERARELLSLDPRSFSQTVFAGGDDELGRLELEGERAAFPLHLMRVSEYVRARVALIGDAAHGIHPLSGHGINLGFSDAAELAVRLENLPEWRDPGELSVLRGYARARAEEPVMLQSMTHMLNRLFRGRHPVLRFVRNEGMNLTGCLPVLRSALIRYATSGKF